MAWTDDQREVNAFLLTVPRIGRNTARALATEIPTLQQLRKAGPLELKQALLDSRIFTMDGPAERKAEKYHADIQDRFQQLDQEMN